MRMKITILSLKIGLKRKEQLNLNSAQMKLMKTEMLLPLSFRSVQWFIMLINLPMNQKCLLLKSVHLLMIILNLRLFLIKMLNILINSVLILNTELLRMKRLTEKSAFRVLLIKVLNTRISL